MQVQFTTQKLIDIFIQADDFCKAFASWATRINPSKYRPIRGKFSESEMMTVLICFPLSGYKNFEYYYKEMIKQQLKTWFPKAPEYSYFIQLIPRISDQMYLFQKLLGLQAQKTGVYFIDSKKLPVCHERRIGAHRVFQGLAQHGKSSTGWFYGLKIHLVINHLGQIVSSVLTSGNVADNNANVLHELLDSLEGKCIGDKGYLTQFFRHFYENGLHLVTKPRKNMKSNAIPLTLQDKRLLNKRGVIESVNDILMTICNIEHTRHRSATNAFVHIFASLVAYNFIDSHPNIDIHFAG
jgi:Transposase DDE domain